MYYICRIRESGSGGSPLEEDYHIGEFSLITSYVQMKKQRFAAWMSAYILAAILIFGALPSSAQRINALTVSTFSGYSTIYGQGGTVTLASPSGSISGQYSFALPFAFKYDDNTYSAGTTFYVQIAGSASFVSNTGSSYNNILTYGTPSNYNSAFAVLSGLQYSSSSYPSKILYQTSGSVGSRVLTVEWYNFADYYNGSQRFSYQLKLYETSNMIEFLYSNYNYTTTNSSYCPSYKKGVGLNGRTTPSFIQNIIVSATCVTPSSNIRFASLPNRQLYVSPKVLDFGQQLQGNTVDLNVTVEHVGLESTLNINSATISGVSASDFTIVSPVTPPQDIPVGGTVTYTIRYTAGPPGPRAAILTFTSNGRDSGTQSVGLTAVGIAPEISVTPGLLFKGVRNLLGTYSEQQIIITSKSTAPLFFTNYPNSFTFTGDNAGEYSISRLPMNPLPGGMTDTLVVRFAPTVEGAHLGTVVINSNAYNAPIFIVNLKGIGTLPHITVTPEVMVFDSVAVGESATKTFTVYNPGSDTLILTNNFFSSADADFTLSPLMGTDAIIPPERSREVGVTFTPLQRGTRMARYRVMTNIPLTFEQVPRDTATNSLYFEINGTGMPVGSLASTDLTNLEDSSLIGKKLCREVTITNPGDADIAIESALFTGTAAGDYQLGGLALPYLLKAKSSVTAQVCGTPSERGSRTVSLTLTGSSNGRTKSLAGSVNVRGLQACGARTPDVAFAASKIVNDRSDTAIVTVTNCGDIAATFAATISGTDAALYTVTPMTIGPIDPNMSAPVTVIFTPTSRGAKTATLTFTDNASNISPMSVSLAGEGACATPGAMPTVEAPATPINASSEVTVSVANNGNLDWDYGTPTVTPADAFSYVSGPATIAAGGTGNLVFKFQPPTMTTYTAQVTFPNAGPCQENIVTVNLTGMGTEAAAVKDVRTADGFALSQNAPNPALSGVTTFSYTAPQAAEVRIVLADVTGKTVRELVNTRVSSGTYTVDVNTTGLASGSYLYIMEAGSARLVRQMVVKK